MLCGCGFWFVPCSLLLQTAGAPPEATVEQIDRSLERAGKYLIAEQSEDGAWRSEIYGALRSDPALTAHVASAMVYLPQAGPAGRTAFRRGVEHLVQFVDGEGRLQVDPVQLFYPVYTAAAASRVVVLDEQTPRHALAQQAWLGYLRQRQLGDANGWRPSDPQYGGWGFSQAVPRRPPGDLPPGGAFEANLSATVYGIAALRSARVPADDPAFQQALAFAKRCQNFSDDGQAADPQFDDGGFFFTPSDPWQNKAALAGEDRFGRQRYVSYGSMTADGVRVLVRCGLPLDHPRVTAARVWLENNFSAERNPGRFAADREWLRQSTYYYWAWAAAHAMIALEIRRLNTSAGPTDWAEALAAALLERQRPDGSWSNSVAEAREDDPLVATAWAASTLAICRSAVRGEMLPCPGAGLREQEDQP